MKFTISESQTSTWVKDGEGFPIAQFPLTEGGKLGLQLLITGIYDLGNSAIVDLRQKEVPGQSGLPTGKVAPLVDSPAFDLALSFMPDADQRN